MLGERKLYYIRSLCSPGLFWFQQLLSANTINTTNLISFVQTSSSAASHPASQPACHLDTSNRLTKVERKRVQNRTLKDIYLPQNRFNKFIKKFSIETFFSTIYVYFIWRCRLNGFGYHSCCRCWWERLVGFAFCFKWWQRSGFQISHSSHLFLYCRLLDSHRLLDIFITSLIYKFYKYGSLWLRRCESQK